MATGLGSGPGNNIRIAVKNVDVVTLTKGSTAALVASAGNPQLHYISDEEQTADFGAGNRKITENKLLGVILGSIDSSGEGGASAEIGIVEDDILPGETGYIVVFGMVQTKWVGTLTASTGAVLGCATGGTVGPAASGTNANPIGTILEAASTTAGELNWTFVNFFNKGIPTTATYTQTTNYYGKAF